MPLINKPRLALYHQGNLPGATSAVYLCPKTPSGVVVLSNGYGFCDAPDWVAQLIIEELFEIGSETDYVALARDAADASKAIRLSTVQKFEGIKVGDTTPSTKQKELEGRYHNAAGSFFVEIFSEKGDLRIAFQGQRGDAFTLRNLHGTTYTWFTSTRDMAQRGRHIHPAPYYNIRFQKDFAFKVVGLKWAHHGSDASREFFIKDGLDASALPRTLLWTLVSLGVGVVIFRIYVVNARKAEGRKV
ncbi:uncharacterized protein LMH87_008887 [Akanthomyces muscarius]|uniref:Beta-lactamase-related domain-containing protein n=1 Tax=Akanthomyces muscarius TaxID=2231603 RepID=A0A9W8QK33_AKAMU|nr:uncharacterized protein LMH87_008887 [Akanthomyces muscarius]KAJ4158357.1 hypothetical protein LMH87_008887 [Akanthomyces muscarius]